MACTLPFTFSRMSRLRSVNVTFPRTVTVPSAPTSTLGGLLEGGGSCAAVMAQSALSSIVPSHPVMSGTSDRVTTAAARRRRAARSWAGLPAALGAAGGPAHNPIENLLPFEKTRFSGVASESAIDWHVRPRPMYAGEFGMSNPKLPVPAGNVTGNVIEVRFALV